jgi:predicted nuclease with TOPRIM domain
MTTNFQTYLNYLASFADSHTLAVKAETSVFPLFSDIKRLIEHYRGTIAKFDNVQHELIDFVERLEFDENDFDYYQEKLKKLQKIEGYIGELKSKKVPDSITDQVQDFINNIYSTTSLYSLDKAEEQVLSYHNRSAEVERYEQYEKERRASKQATIIGLTITLIIVIFIIAKCNS